MMDDKAAFKDRLVKSCLNHLSEKINEINLSLRELQDSANSETKSSMGDKYETGRSMVMLEKEKLLSQYFVLSDQYSTLRQIKIKNSDKVEFGSLVKTRGQFFLLSVSLGNYDFEEMKIFLISIASPIATAITGLKKGDFYEFQGKREKIEELY